MNLSERSGDKELFSGERSSKENISKAITEDNSNKINYININYVDNDKLEVQIPNWKMDIIMKMKRRIKKEVTPEPQATTNKKEIYQEIVKKNSNIDSNEIEIPEELKLEVLRSIQRQHTRLKMKEDNLNRLKMQIA